jgi:hypothetical protein
MIPFRLRQRLLYLTGILLAGFAANATVAQDEDRFQAITVKDGTLYFEDGSEVALWGVNFQTSMSWEHDRFQRLGMHAPFDLKAYQAMADRSFDEIQLLGCDVIRIHLSPGDFTDARGNLIENEWLAMLDYTLAACSKRGIYVNFALLNHLGQRVKHSFASGKHGRDVKWEWITVPEKLEASERYIRQLVNRRNRYDGGRRYKDNPAWVVAEFMNEPMYPTEKPSRETAPDGVRVYEQWLDAEDMADTTASFRQYKYQTVKAYIERLMAVLEEEGVRAVPCWNLFWVRGPQHEGWESYEAAAATDIPLVSFSTYPGQSEIQAVNRRPTDLSDKNFLPYLRKAYEDHDWQAWVRDDRFKGKKATLVYEYEAWANQSAYIYPAMAAYFRAQGAQVVTMWTYALNGLAPYLDKKTNHNLNVRTTPRKAAAFMVAGEIFRNTPRFTPFATTKKDGHRSDRYAYSSNPDFGAYADGQQWLSSGLMKAGELIAPENPSRIIGYGSSPLVEYDGEGMYFLERKQTTGRELWTLVVLPHARFLDEPLPATGARVELDPDRVASMKIRFGTPAAQSRVYRVDGEALIPVARTEDSKRLALDIKPGNYVIERMY